VLRLRYRAKGITTLPDSNLSPDVVTAENLKANPTLALAFGLGAGLAPIAPGTVGTVVAIPIWWLLSQFNIAIYLVIVGVLFALGVWVCGRAAAQLTYADHPGIVFDEWVGFLVAMALAPRTWLWLILGFVLFRCLDIFKPWPVSWLDKNVKGGLGIMADDVAAGVYTLLILAAVRWLWV